VHEPCHSSCGTTNISFYSKLLNAELRLILDMTSSYKWLIIYSFMSCSRIFLLYGDVTIASEGLQNLGLCSAFRAFEQGGILIVPQIYCDTGPLFPGLIQRTAPFSRLIRLTRGCGGSIVTQIHTGLHISEKFIYTSINQSINISRKDRIMKSASSQSNTWGK
jgi:hypothetical protein